MAKREKRFRPDQRHVVGAQTAQVTDWDHGDEECEQGKDHPSDADCKKNLAIHG